MPLAQHHSQDSYYRSPTGAVPCATRVTLRLRIEAARQASEVEVRTWQDGREQVLPMCELGVNGVWSVYEAVVVAPALPGLVWYSFRFVCQGRTVYVGNNEQRLGGMGQVWEKEPASFQISVYEPDFAPPAWMREGIMYQIFPDRFYDGCRGELLKRRGDIRVHEDWYEAPDPVIAGLPGDQIARDFFGGNLHGIEQKLDYLEGLGITALYLNPIFRAHSNHKYDTGDYRQIDPTFGDVQDFHDLCTAAKKRGIRVVLDGVFSHTGEDSVYFNRYGRYPEVGAYQSLLSPYASWFQFEEFPDKYTCWWGVPSLPEVREMEGSFLDFIIRAPDAVIARWLREGAGGWRLDVADELPDEFIEMLRARVKSEDADACIIGEVWEDATNKIAYGQPRRYALGNGLDSVMNYPLRAALIAFLRGEEGAMLTRARLLSQRENYPRPMYYALMNLMGSHDRARILNVLAGCDEPDIAPEQRGQYRLEEAQYAKGCARLGLMLSLVASLPGMPCVYYGDEAGMQGLGDPYCRGGYPWGRELAPMVDFFKTMLGARRRLDMLRTGEMEVYAPHEDVLCIVRWIRGGKDCFGQERADGICVMAVNRADQKMRRVVLELSHLEAELLYDGQGRTLDCPGGMVSLTLAPMAQALWMDENSANLLNSDKKNRI